MNKKKIILSIIFTIFAVANVVLYLIFKQQYLDVLKQGYDLLNRPLPIVGVTTIAVLIFIWRMVIAFRYGEGNLNKIKKEYREQLASQSDLLKEYDNKLEEAHKEIDEMNKFLVKLCDLLRNQKIKQLAEELNHGERTNSDSEKE